MTSEEHKALSKSISNEEAPEVLFGSLHKIHQYLESILPRMNGERLDKYNIFKVFYMQYNTVLSLAQKTDYVFMQHINYLDVKSIYVLTRALHELYLQYVYLSFSTVFEGCNPHDELKFKHLAYQYSGQNDFCRTISLAKRLDRHENYDEDIETETIEEKKKLWLEIKNNPVYDTLSREAKDHLKNGKWKISAESVLSWNDLADRSHLSKPYGTFIYHLLSLYAHSTFSSMKLQANHNQDINGLLCHCYVLASVFAVSALDSFDQKFNTTTILNDKEKALIIDFWNLAVEQRD